MANQDTELTEKLKSLANKPTPVTPVSEGATASFIAPITESVTELKGDTVKLEDTVKPPVTPNTTATDKAKPAPDDVQMDNLINEAKARNEKLNSKKIDFDTTTLALPTNEMRVRQLLKDHGMDSQQADKCYNELVKLVN